MTTHDCVIVGAGIHGLCTAFWLHRRGVRRLCVVDQFDPGHDRGSSHGATRITRCLYQDPDLVQLARRANEHGWPALEAAMGRPLRLPTPGVFFGPGDGPLADYLTATAHHRDRTEVLDGERAGHRFPLLRIPVDDTALVDHTAAVLLAAATMQGLRAWLADRGVELRWHTRVHGFTASDHGVRMQLGDGQELHAGRAVLAAGAWLPQLVPATAPLTVLRQQVGYFDVDAATSDCRAGAFPVWARIGRGANDFVYGLPDVEGSGLKAAVHRTEGAHVDPDAAAEPVDEPALLALGRASFTAPVRRLLGTERCLYTMAAGQRLAVARAPGTAALVTITACSGHAFKFGPVLGERAAALASDEA
ncbi:MAG: FAD-dependent oxidoreductase [Planctomycetes bacterium]|jgi:sarcosine oxidase|nr:FAD-dependent oxidoreductase [Planctomycetota bacterium]